MGMGWGRAEVWRGLRYGDGSWCWNVRVQGRAEAWGRAGYLSTSPSHTHPCTSANGLVCWCVYSIYECKNTRNSIEVKLILNTLTIQ